MKLDVDVDLVAIQSGFKFHCPYLVRGSALDSSNVRNETGRRWVGVLRRTAFQLRSFGTTTCDGGGGVVEGA